MHVPGQGSRKSKKLADDIIGEEDYMPTDEVKIQSLSFSVIGQINRVNRYRGLTKGNS